MSKFIRIDNPDGSTAPPAFLSTDVIRSFSVVDTGSGEYVIKYMLHSTGATGHLYGGAWATPAEAVHALSRLVDLEDMSVF